MAISQMTITQFGLRSPTTFFRRCLIVLEKAYIYICIYNAYMCIYVYIYDIYMIYIYLDFPVGKPFCSWRLEGLRRFLFQMTADLGSICELRRHLKKLW